MGSLGLGPPHLARATCLAAAGVLWVGCTFGPTTGGATGGGKDGGGKDGAVDAAVGATTDATADAKADAKANGAEASTDTGATVDGQIGVAPLQCPSASDAGARVLTGRNDSLRTGWYPDEPGLSPAIVGGPSFGRLFKTQLAGAGGDAGSDAGSPSEVVTAQPLVVGSTVFVVTESNDVYSLDAQSGAILASRAFGTPLSGTDVTCADLPTIGITGTPVIDPSTNTAYFFSKAFKTNVSAVGMYAHAVDTQTLAERPGFPVEITGAADNDSSVVFDPLVESQRPALLLMNGTVYAAFGSHCDQGEFHGFVVGVSVDGHLTAMFATEAGTTKARGAGFWHSGGGIVSDGPGRMLLISSNGYSMPISTPMPGSSPPTTLDESVVRFQVQPDGSLQVADFFTPYDVATLDQANVDFGSGGPVGLPDCFGSPAHPHLLVAAGKQGRVYLLDRDHLGGFLQGPSQSDDIVNVVDARDGLWSVPALWPGDGGWMYIVPSGAPFQAFAFGRRSDGVPTFTPTGVTSDNFGTSSGSPIVTSDGTVSGSALVWIGYATGEWKPGALRAYSPIPDSTGTLKVVWEDAYGNSAKFGVPGVGGNRVYMGTSDGYVLGYGATTTTSVSGTPVDFGPVVVGQSTERDVVITANQATQVTGISSDSPVFQLTAGMPSLPASLPAGGSLAIPVTFAPLGTSGYVGALEVTTSAGAAAVSLQGVGQTAKAILTVAPKSLAFEGIPPGSVETLNLILGNGGATPLQFSTVALPSAPFKVLGAPSPGDVLATGDSVTLQVSYTPQAVGMYTDSISVLTNSGVRNIYLSGVSASAAVLTVAPLAIDFGAVTVGKSASRTFTVSNTGGSALTISQSKPPSMGEFIATSTLTEGTGIAGGGSLPAETVSFTPTAAGTFTDRWAFDSSAGAGTTYVTFTGTGVAADAGP